MFDFMKSKLMDLQEQAEKNMEAKLNAKPSSTPLFTFNAAITGVDYPSVTKPTKIRRQLLAKDKNGSPAILQPFTFEGSPAFYVIDKRKNDVGCLPAIISYYLVNMVVDMRVVAFLDELETVVPKVTVNVFGRLKNDYKAYDGTPGLKGKEYKYNLDYMSDKLYLLPPFEVYCDLKETDNGFDVYYDGTLLSRINDKRKGNLSRMLKENKCTTTVLNHIGSTGFMDMYLRF